MAAKIEGEMVSITYNFLFSKESNIWNNIYSFEGDLSDFFAANGLECEVITTISGSTGGRMLLIKKIEESDAEKKLINTKGVNLAKQLPEQRTQKTATIVKSLTRVMDKQFRDKKGGKR